MKSKLVVLAIGGSLLLASPALRAADTTNPPPSRPMHKAMEHPLLMGVYDKLNLTDDQKAKIKTIEESFLQTRREYLAAHKAEIDTAREAVKDARTSGDETKKAEARQKMQQALSGLQPQRKAAMDQILSLLTDEQKKTLEETRKEFRESHGGPPAAH